MSIFQHILRTPSRPSLIACPETPVPVSPAPWDPMLVIFFFFDYFFFFLVFSRHLHSCAHCYTKTNTHTHNWKENKINLIFKRERDCQSFLLSKCLFPLGSCGCFWNMPQVWSCLHRTNFEGDQIKTAEKRALKGAANQVKWRQSCEMGLGVWGLGELRGIHTFLGLRGK